jgi:hypothetical protein
MYLYVYVYMYICILTPLADEIRGLIHDRVVC